MRFNAPTRRCVRGCAASTTLLVLAACGGGGGGGVPSGGDTSLDDPPLTVPSAPGVGSPASGAGTGAPLTPALDGGATGDAVDLRHGLPGRPSLADFALPVEGAGTAGYRAVPVYPNLENFYELVRAVPVPGEDRMLVVEQAGRIRVFDDDPAVETARTILDIRTKVAFTSEQGLLGFAFDPAFERNRYVYIYYTHASDGRSIVSRLTWDAATDTLDQGTDRQILQVEQPYTNHNAGMIEFGPDDGYLYVALGDGGDGGDPLNNAQDRTTLLGSILRLDVHPSDPNLPYAIPSDNPFVGDGDVRGEIYAYGLRNPYRFSFDRQTGELWAGDVGQQEREEIDLIVAGGNYGWRQYEGTERDPYDKLNDLPESAVVPPVLEYGHDEGLAVIGGYVYRGEREPSLFGRYLFADYAFGTVWALTRGADGSVSRATLTSVDTPTGFAETKDGDVLVISRYGGLLRFEPVEAGPGLPTKLSETGLFTDLATLTPIDGLIGYAPSHPFWSDGVAKRRWLGVPDGARIEFTDDDWTFPVGTVSVKHFEVATIEGDPDSIRRLETRVLLHTTSGWEGYSYHWDADQADATLANGQRFETLSVALAAGGTHEQRYEYPSRASCAACHTPGAGFLLGPKTAQLNTGFAYPDGRANQLETLDHIGLFDRDVDDAADYGTFPPIGDEASAIGARARAYLDVNCSSCHMPGGSAPTSMDLRASLPLEAMKVVDVAPSVGDLGIAGARIVAAGEREASVLWQRMRRTDEARMPPISSHVVDRAGVDLIGAWIDQLP